MNSEGVLTLDAEVSAGKGRCRSAGEGWTAFLVVCSLMDSTLRSPDRVHRIPTLACFLPGIERMRGGRSAAFR